MQLLLILAGIGIILVVILSRTIGRSGRYYLKLVPAILCLLLGLGLIGWACMVNVKPDHLGIVKSNGAIQNEVLNSGWNMVNPTAEVIQLDASLQNDTIYRTTSSENTSNNDTLSGYTSDGKEIKIAMVVTYLINPTGAGNLYKEAGPDFKQNIVQPISHNLLLRETKLYDSKALSTDIWIDFKTRLNDDLKQEFKKHGLALARATVFKLEPEAPVMTATEKIAGVVSNIPSKNVVKKEQKKTIAPKKEPIPIAAVKPKISKSKTPSKVVAAVKKTSAVKAKISSSHTTKTIHTARKSPRSAPVDTMYHHKLKEETAILQQADTMFRSTVTQKVEPVHDSVISSSPVALENSASSKIDTLSNAIPATPSALPVADNNSLVPETTPPMDSGAFGSMKDFLRMHKTDDKKLEALKGISQTNAFTSEQVLNIDNTLSGDDAKLEFAKMAYSRTVDRKNYGMVASSLNRRSKSSLDKYIMTLMASKNASMPPAAINPAVTNPIETASNTSATTNNSPKFVVPADCRIIDEERYIELRKRIVADNTKDANQQFLKSTIENNCFTTEQVRSMLKLVHSKKTKLEMAKLAYPRTVDRNKYSIVANSFSKKQKRALDKYIIRMMAVSIASKLEAVPIAGDTHQYILDGQKVNKPIDDLLLKSLKEFTSEHFSDDSKMAVLDKILNTNYFTAAQIADIAKLFKSAGSRLEFAKLAYNRTVDKGMYNLVITSLDDNSQRQLEDYIIGTFASR